MPTFGGDPVRNLLDWNIGPREFESSAKCILHGGSEVRRKFVLQYDSDTAGVEVASGIAEGAGGQVREKESVGRGDFAQTSQGGIRDAVGKHRDLEIRL